STPMMEGPGADSEEKHEPVSDIDTVVVVVGLKALDPEWPIREAIGGIADLVELHAIVYKFRSHERILQAGCTGPWRPTMAHHYARRLHATLTASLVLGVIAEAAVAGGLEDIYRVGAEKGNASAQFSLGFMYEKGQGVPQDYVQAYMWFNLAAAQGTKGAAEWREHVAVHMTPAQIAEAQ